MFSSLSKPFTVAWLSTSEEYLLVFGIILVVGLVGEFWIDHKSKKYSRVKKRKRLFEILVIAGVAGEIIADGGIFEFGDHLQDLINVEVAQLNREAGNARKSAGIAEKEAGQANEMAAKNELEAKRAGTNAAASYERAAVAEKEAAQANQLAAEYNERSKQLESTNVQLSLQMAQLMSNNFEFAKELLAQAKQIQETTNNLATIGNFVSESNTTRLRIENQQLAESVHADVANVQSILTHSNLASLKPAKRHLTDDKIAALAKDLNGQSRGTILFELRAGAYSEAVQYRDELKSLFSKLGYHVGDTGNGMMETTGTGGEGLTFGVRISENLPAFGIPIVQALHKEDIQFTTEPDNGATTNMLILMVGRNPQ